MKVNLTYEVRMQIRMKAEYLGELILFCVSPVQISSIFTSAPNF